MYNIQSTMYNEQHTKYITMYNVQYSMFNVCTMCSGKMYNVVELKSTPIAIILQYENLLYWDISNQWPYPLLSIK